MVADYEAYERFGTLQGIPLLGGDRAVMDPKRVVTAIQLELGIPPTMMDGDAVELYSKMMDKSVKASSMGRVLDAVSCILGICCKRTYEGEPAIKLERWLEKGEPGIGFDLEFKNIHGLDTAMTIPMLSQLMDMKIGSDRVRADAAASFVKTLVEGIAARACDRAEHEGLKQVGLSGGVSFSAPISNWVRTAVETRGLEFVCHERIPNGDGGISTGQNAIVGASLG
jgi:hydrogenase maturation protein HypF